MITVYVSIGNTDGKLTHTEWAEFYALTAELLGTVEAGGVGLVKTTLGAWHSLPATPYVNACWAIMLDQRDVEAVTRGLGALARRFRQDSIAWAEVDATYFVEPT